MGKEIPDTNGAVSGFNQTENPGFSSVIPATDDQKGWLKHWETLGEQELIVLSLKSATGDNLSKTTQSAHNNPTQAFLPENLNLAAAVNLFLTTLKGQSEQTQKTYRVGCRRFLWFIYASGRGNPATITVYSLSPFILEEYYLWLVETYGRQARATTSLYLTANRNLFEFLARRHLTPQGCQYQEMIAGLARLQGRATYRTPRVKGKQVEQVVKLVIGEQEPDQPPTTSDLVYNEPPGERRHIRKPPPPGGWKAKSDKEKARQDLEELRDRAIILTLYTTGLRRQEVANLNRADLEPILIDADLFKTGQPSSKTVSKEGESELELCKVEKISAEEPTELEKGLVYELIITGKGQKERLAYFDRATLAAIAEYLSVRGKDSYRPLFIQHHRNRDLTKPGLQGQNYRLSLAGIWHVVNKYAHLIGVEIHPHDFRHNLATTLLNAGAQLSEVQDILGHASPVTTKQIYAHYEKSHLREAFSRFRKSVEEL